MVRDAGAAPWAAAAKIVTGNVAKSTYRQIRQRARVFNNPDIAEKIGATGAMIQPTSNGNVTALLRRRRILECDVAGRNVDHVDGKPAKFKKDVFYGGPFCAELRFVFRFPLSPDLLGEIWWRPKVTTGDIKEERASNDRLFDNEKCVVKAN